MDMMDLIIRNGTIIYHDKRVCGDIAVKDEKIVDVGYLGDMQAKKEIDAAGKIIVPGGIDTHTHHENPFMGVSGADNFYFGSIAAAHGGTTTMIDFSQTDKGRLPYEFVQGRIQQALDSGIVIDYSFHIVLKEVTDDNLAEVKRLVDSGLGSFKVFMIYPDEMLDDGALLALLTEAAKHGGLVGVHAENAAIAAYNVKKALAAGTMDWIDHARTKPNIVEYEAVSRAYNLAKSVGAAMFIYHTSAGESAQILMEAKAKGEPLYAETCAHYLTLSEDILLGEEGYLNLCSPPPRKKQDNDMLWEAIRRKAIRCTGSDHSSFTRAEKELHMEKGPDGKWLRDFRIVANGNPGIEFQLPTLINGVAEGKLSWEQLVDAHSYGAARIFGMYPQKGEILPGSDADIVIIDTEKTVTINSHEDLYSHCDYTPYVGLTYKGWPETTISRGRIIFDKGEYIEAKGHGRFVQQMIDPQIIRTSDWD